MFLDFKCLSEHKKLNSQGVGLGLSVCKMIIEKMEGYVTVDSVLGEGTTFRVSIKSFCRIKRDGPGETAELEIFS